MKKRYIKFIAFIVLTLVLVLSGCGDKPKDETHKLIIECVGNNDEENVLVTVTNVNDFAFPEIKKEGHQLVKWCADEDLTEEFDIETAVGNVDLSLLAQDIKIYAYAKWKTLDYKVNFIADDKILFSQMVSYGKSARAPIAPEKAGFNFDSWDADYTCIKGDIDIHAIYVARPLTITYIDQNTGEVLTNIEPATYMQGETVQLESLSKDGYEFEGWFLSEISMYPIKELSSSLVGDLKIYARFTETTKHKEFVLPEATYHFTDIVVRNNCYQPVFPSGADSNTQNYDWSTSDPSIATVSSWSSISCLEAGYCVLTATKKTDTSYTVNCVIRVTTEGAKFATVEEANTFVTHKVIFHDVLGNVIKECTVEDGGHVLCPIPPVVEGYAFMGWDKDCYNIKEDTIIKPIYQEGAKNPYAGKKMAIIGDSISTFREVIPEGYSCFYPYPTGDTNDFNQTWWMQVCNKLGSYLFVNNSYSGSCVAAKSESSTNKDGRLASTVIQGETPDVILIYMGSNDAASSAVNETMFASEYRVMLDKLKALCPNSEIVLMELPVSKLYSKASQASYNAIIGECATEYNLKLLKTSELDFTDLLIDSAHPLTAGHTKLAEIVLSELLK